MNDEFDSAVARVIPKPLDIINIEDVIQYKDRWYLAFIDLYTIKENKKIGQLMYESNSFNSIFSLTPYNINTPESFTSVIPIDKCTTRFGLELPSEINLLDMPDNTDYDVINIFAYSSAKGIAKARAQYFIDNKKLLKFDHIGDDVIYMKTVHPPKLSKGKDDGNLIFKGGESIDVIRNMENLTYKSQKEDNGTVESN